MAELLREVGQVDALRDVEVLEPLQAAHRRWEPPERRAGVDTEDAQAVQLAQLVGKLGEVVAVGDGDGLQRADLADA